VRPQDGLPSFDAPPAVVPAESSHEA
jgi:hypothetical protein